MIDDNLRKQIIKELTEKERFVIFAGAGVPKSAGVPDWKELLIELLNVSSIKKYNMDNEDPITYPDIAQELYNDLKSKGQIDIYYNTLKQMLKPKDSQFTTGQLKIVKASKWVVTTNFENTFEQAFQEKYNRSCNVMCLPDFRPDDYFKAGDELIVYLHGRVDDEYIIFNREEFDSYYPSSNNSKPSCKDLENYLSYLYKHHTLVFTGFSFTDEYFFNALKSINQDIKVSDDIALRLRPSYDTKISRIKHYAFLKKVDFGLQNVDLIKNMNAFVVGDENYKKVNMLLRYQNVIDELKKINVEVIPYDNHIEWQDCLDEIHNNIINKLTFSVTP